MDHRAPPGVQQREVRLARKDRVAVLKHVMAGPVGREWIWHLLSECGIFTSFVDEHHVMAFKEGKRTIGLKVYEDIQSDDECRQLFNTAQNEYIRRTET